jgi:hypothetical protein
MAEVVNVIWAENEAEYLCNDHWTGQISLIRQKKLDFRRDAMDQPLPAALARSDAASRTMLRIPRRTLRENHAT